MVSLKLMFYTSNLKERVLLNSGNKKFKLGKRLFAIFFVLIAVLFFMIGKLTYLMVAKANTYKQAALKQRTIDITISPKRGNILDRNGELLATSLSAFRIDVDMNALTASLKRKKMTKDDLVNSLSSTLSMSTTNINNILYPERSDGSKIKYAILARQIDKSVADKIKALDLNGLIISSDTKREYPNNNFLSNVIGYTNLEGNGVAGVELNYNKELCGIPGKKELETDKNKNQLPYNDSLYVAPIDGKDIYLTIDKQIQLYAEQAAQKTLSENKAKSVTITVMDPKTGEILAMVNKPDYNPNTPHANPPSGVSQTVDQLWQNNAVQSTFEPGSIFKVITAYTGLASGTVTDINAYNYECNGSKIVDKATINCWKPGGHGSENFIDILKNSCNVGFMELGAKIGKDNLYKYINLFGFGQKTGIDLPGEASGIVNNINKVHNVELANISFGQGIAVTSVQYMAAFNSIANNGTWIRPHIMSKITHTKNGNPVVDKNYDNLGSKKILDENLINTLKTGLRAVVQDKNGVGHNADIPGYDIAGKTGTAQIAGKTGYDHSKYMASFAGMAPANDPKITLLVSVNQPNSENDSYYASTVAAPVAKDLYQQIFNYYASKGLFQLPASTQTTEAEGN